MDQEKKFPPQVALPEDLHRILKQRSDDTGISIQRLVADALFTGMSMKRWMPRRTNADSLITGKNSHLQFAAMQEFNKAMRTGKIKKEKCAICGSKRTQGHHEDYSKPLEVVWLCAYHHSHAHWPGKYPNPSIEKSKTEAQP